MLWLMFALRLSYVCACTAFDDGSRLMHQQMASMLWSVSALGCVVLKVTANPSFTYVYLDHARIGAPCNGFRASIVVLDCLVQSIIKLTIWPTLPAVAC